AQCFRIKQGQAQGSQRGIPGKAQSRQHAAAQREVGSPILRIRRSSAGEDQVSESRLIEFPKGFVIGFQLWKIARKLRIAGCNGGAQQAIERLSILLQQLRKIRLQMVIRPECRLLFGVDRVHVCHFLCLPRTKRHFENQHPPRIEAAGLGEDALHGKGLTVLSLKDQTPAGSIPVNTIVRFTGRVGEPRDRKSTRLNSSHVSISYAVFCLKKKTNKVATRPPANHLTAYTSFFGLLARSQHHVPQDLTAFAPTRPLPSPFSPVTSPPPIAP